MKARLVDANDVAHEVQVLKLDVKSALIGPQPVLVEKDKVRLELSDSGESLVLSAHFPKAGEPGENQVLALFPPGAKLKKRLLAFLDRLSLQ